MDTTWRDKGIVRWTIMGLLVVAFLGAAAWYVNEQNNRGLPEGFAAGNGRLEADQIDLATRLGGRVSEIRVSEGDLVQAGDVVAVMDTSELQALLSSAQADAARAESQINEVRALIQQRERTWLWHASSSSEPNSWPSAGSSHRRLPIAPGRHLPSQKQRWRRRGRNYPRPSGQSTPRGRSPLVMRRRLPIQL